MYWGASVRASRAQCSSRQGVERTVYSLIVSVLLVLALYLSVFCSGSFTASVLMSVLMSVLASVLASVLVSVLMSVLTSVRTLSQRCERGFVLVVHCDQTTPLENVTRQRSKLITSHARHVHSECRVERRISYLDGTSHFCTYDTPLT